MKKSLLLAVILIAGYFVFTGQKVEEKSGWGYPFTIAFDKNAGPSNFVPLDYNPAIKNYRVVLMSPYGVNAINPSFRVFPTTATQSEIQAYSNPNVPGALIVGWNSYGPSFYGTGFAYTSNGGLNWTGNNTLPGLAVNSGDPSTAINSSGTIFMNAIGTGSGAANMNTSSTNGGVNWTPYVTTGSSGYMADKNHLAIDDKSTSPYYNNLYVGWSDFYSSSAIPPIRFSRSTDNGATWMTATNITGPLSGYFNQGVNIHTGPNGEVYMVYCTGQSGSPYTGKFVGFGKSTNGGLNWTQVENKITMSGIRGTLKTTAIRVNDFPWMAVDKTGGSYNGNIYVVWNQKNLAPAGADPDICFAKSTDGGTTFSSPIRINQDLMNNGRDQWMPSICVDGYGGVNIVYYDSRNPTTNDSAEVYVARSIDGGSTFTDNLVSDHRFKPKPISGLAGGYQGDYIGIAAVGNKVYPFWADDFSGVYQTWTAPIDLGPSITHTPLGNTEQTTLTRTVNCTITPAGSPINPSTVKLYYSKDNPVLTTNVTMTNSGGNNWTAPLTLSGPGLYRYYITATDNISRTATYPAGAPTNTVQFIAATDTVKPVITHTPLLNQPKVTWPATVTATVTDNIGIDSVWVKWYKNSTSTGIKQFKLLNTGGSTYTALFNSLNADVAINDSIFYRVFARDNSSMHNADSTALNKFKIINENTITVGNGTTAYGWPFYTFYMDSRTQMLWTAAELQAAGGAIGYIKKIGFDVVSAAPQVMNGYSVKFQNTTMTTISSWVTTGWTTAVSGTYSVAGTGWQLQDMPSPYFTWDGTSNLLMEICFDNTSYTSNSTVNGTASSGFTYHQHVDNGTGCTLSGTNSATGRPNLRLVMEGIINSAGNENNVIPNNYSLSQNYPNPFNPVTKINFAIPKQGLVTMKIYDLLGREIKTLVNEVKTAGNYSVDFNASEFASGVYFYKLESGTFSEVKRMMLIK